MALTSFTIQGVDATETDKIVYAIYDVTTALKSGVVDYNSLSATDQAKYDAFKDLIKSKALANANEFIIGSIDNIDTVGQNCLSVDFVEQGNTMITDKEIEMQWSDLTSSEQTIYNDFYNLVNSL